MPNTRERKRNNTKTGVFVAVSVILAMIVIALLTDAVERFTRRADVYTVTFPVRSGVGNLKQGSEVRVGGVRLGDVVVVVPPVREPYDEIAVEFRIDSRVRLHQGAIIYVASPLIGAESWLEIAYTGDPEGDPMAGRTIAGRPGLGMLAAMLGVDYSGRAAGMIEDVGEFTAFLANVPDEYDTHIVPTLERVGRTTERIEQIVARIQDDDWPQWAAHVTAVLAWAEGATADLDELLGRGNTMLATLQEVVDENRPDIRTTLHNFAEGAGEVRQVVQRVRDETVDRVHAMLNSGQTGLDRATGILEAIQVDYDRWATEIGEALARANLASQQLKLTMIEVRRNPWKVLYRPGQREIEHELLYDAARSFAMAAADLRAASSSVQRILDNHGERLAEDKDALERITNLLLEPMDRYTQAQERLLNVLFYEGAR
jgi:ABC-type transporter Mla subunit MlaD